MPLPPWMSIASLTTCEPTSVAWYFAIALGTEGFSPMSTAAAVMRDNAVIA